MTIDDQTNSAYAEPVFCIQHEGRYYLTLAVLEYDPNQPDMTPEQRKGVEQIEQLYQGTPQTESMMGVVRIPPFDGALAMNTGPQKKGGI